MNKILQEVWLFFKTNFLVIAIITFVILYFSGCLKGVNTPKSTSDTITHTTQVPQPIIVVPPYVPQQQGGTTYVSIPSGFKGEVPASTFDSLVVQVKRLGGNLEALAKEYYAIRHYKDSIQLQDTAGKRVGVVNLDQTVSENTLKSTQPSYQLNFPYTERIITNTIYPKPKNKWYIGLEAGQQIEKQVSDFQIKLLLQNKREDVLSFGAGLTTNNSKVVSVGFFKKLHF